MLSRFDYLFLQKVKESGNVHAYLVQWLRHSFFWYRTVISRESLANIIMRSKNVLPCLLLNVHHRKLFSVKAISKPVKIKIVGLWGAKRYIVLKKVIHILDQALASFWKDPSTLKIRATTLSSEKFYQSNMPLGFASQNVVLCTFKTIWTSGLNICS